MNSSLLISLHSFGLFWQNKKNQKHIILPLVFTLLQLILIIYFYDSLPPQVPLFMGRAWGEDRLASANMLFILPGISLLITVTNTLVSFNSQKTSSQVAKTLLAANTLLSFTCLVALLRIYTLAL